MRVTNYLREFRIDLNLIENLKMKYPKRFPEGGYFIVLQRKVLE